MREGGRKVKDVPGQTTFDGKVAKDVKAKPRPKAVPVDQIPDMHQIFNLATAESTSGEKIEVPRGCPGWHGLPVTDLDISNELKQRLANGGCYTLGDITRAVHLATFSDKDELTIRLATSVITESRRVDRPQPPISDV